MVSLCLQYGLLISVLGASPPTPAIRTEHRVYVDCFLYEAADGTVAMGTSAISLGMIGVPATSAIQVSKDLAERLAPLVNHTDPSLTVDSFWYFGLPRPREPKASVILVSLETNFVEINEELTSASRPARPLPVYRSPIAREMVSANIFGVELITSDWRRAWHDLTQTLGDIVKAARTEPGEGKREHLRGLFEQGSQALHTMLTTEPAEDEIQAVRRVVPDAQLVRNLRRQIEREWGDTLHWYGSLLGIKVFTTLPAEEPECSWQQKLQILVDSRTPAEFIRKIQESCPSWTLHEGLTTAPIRDRRLYSPVYVSQVANFTPEEFDIVQRQARKDLELHAREQSQRQDPMKGWKEKYKDQVGVEVRVAEESLLRENLFLGGTVVEKVIEPAKAGGLEPGDLIIDYYGTDDLAARQHGHFNLLNPPRPGRALPVLREGRLIRLTIEKPTTSEAQPRSSR